MHRPDSINKAGVTAVATLMCLATAPLFAQELADPTAPPDELLQALAQAASKEAGSKPDGDEASADESSEAKPQQSKPVMIVGRALAGEWRHHAIIDGRVLTMGDEIDVGTIRSISSTDVEFVDGEETRTRSVFDHAVIKEKPDQPATE